MGESLLIPQTTNRKVIYDSLIPQIQALTQGESDLTANLSNISAALKEAFNFFFVMNSVNLPISKIIFFTNYRNFVKH